MSSRDGVGTELDRDCALHPHWTCARKSRPRTLRRMSDVLNVSGNLKVSAMSRRSAHPSTVK